jgi:hypothetical protein
LNDVAVVSKNQDERDEARQMPEQVHGLS